MAGQIYNWSLTAADNDDADNTINWLEGQLPGSVNGSARAMMAALASFIKDNNGTLTSGGSANAQTLTANTSFAALATGQLVGFKAGFTNTAAATLNVNAIGAKDIKVFNPDGEADVGANQIRAGGHYLFRYDAALDGASGAWVLLNPSPSITFDTLGEAGFALIGGKLTASVGASALTIAVKTVGDADPSASSPVLVVFRSATIGNGGYTVMSIEAATSLVISSGSTLGTTNSTPFRLWVGGFNDGGTFRLAASNRFSPTGGVSALADDVLDSATDEGGAGGADSTGVIYAGATITTKPFKLLGYMDWSSGLGTAGTWSSGPDIVAPFGAGMKRPGDVVQVRMHHRSDLVTGTTTLPSDDSIPQQATEGVAYLSKDITPKSKANMLLVDWTVFCANSATGQMSTALFQDATANALAAIGEGYRTADDYAIRSGQYFMLAGTVSATTFAVHAGCNNAGTTSLGGSGGSRQFGGVAASHLRITEIMG